MKQEQVEQLEGCFHGKDFVDAVAHAQDKAERKALLQKGGITGFDDALHDECEFALISEMLRATPHNSRLTA